MKRNLYFSLGMVLLMVLSGFAALAQVKISGKVTNEYNVPFPGVIVQQLNTQNKTATDANGNYTITLSEAGAKSLVFNYLGYTALTLPYSGSGSLNALLKPGTSDLDEVVVLGYTSQKKSALTGATGLVNMADAEKRRVSDVSQVLQGQVAGVQVTQSTGAPGDPINITIRGQGTINGNNPLFIVDGVSTYDISFLNPGDIKTMTVLKDASAAAMYGSRASGGVIVITTNQGASGLSKIDFTYFNGIQKVSNLPKMLNTQQYLNVQEQAWNNTTGLSGTNPYTTAKSRTDLANTDWLKELFETGRSQSAQLSISGGSDKITYLLAGGYYKQDGIVIYGNDGYKRLNFRANVNANVTDRFKVGTNLQISNETQDALSSKGDAPGIIRHAFLRPPVLSVYKDPSDPTWSAANPFTDLPFYKNNNQVNGWDKSFELTSNPIALANFSNDKRTSFRTFGNAYGEYAFLKDKSLKVRTSLGMDLLFRHNKAFLVNFGDDNGEGAKDASGNFIDPGAGRQNRPNGLNEERGQQTNITWTNTVSYDKIIGKNVFNALVGSEYISNKSDAISASRRRYDYTSPSFQYIDLGGTALNLFNGGSGTENNLFSVFGTVTYSYDNKYFVTANMRADASSRFGENNKWGYFPSFSAGWKISEENFMKPMEWISDLKLRASYGSLGNQYAIGDYDYQTLFTKDGEEYKKLRYGNPDLKWERVTQANIGLDLGLIKNSVYISMDYFQKVTSDILLPLQLPGFIGDLQPTRVNAGEVKNKGFEFGLTYVNNDHAFKYRVNGNFATLSNQVTKLHPNLPLVGADNSPYRTVVGQPINAYYGYKMVGIYQNASEIASYLHGTQGYAQKPGDIKFADLNNDGIIDDKDRTFLGSNIPKFTYGLNLSGSYRGFDLSVLLQGVQGVDRYNQLKQIIDYDTRPFNHTTAVLDAWHGEGTSNTTPRLSQNATGGEKISSIFVEDASYLRIKNVELGYSFGNVIKKLKMGVQDIRLYVSGQNLYTRTKYTGLDPETVDLIDYGTYPQSKAYLFGVNIKF